MSSSSFDAMDSLPIELRGILCDAGWKNVLHIEAAVDDSQSAADLLRVLLPLGMEEQAIEWGELLYTWCEGQRDHCRQKRRRVTDLDFGEKYEFKLRGVVAVAREATLAATTSIERFCTIRHWRTARERKLSKATSADEKASIEQAERSRWLSKLVAIVQEAGLPVVAKAATASDPLGALQHIAGARRSKTIRSRVRTWLKLSEWLQLSWGVSYPKSVGNLIDYLTDVFNGGCGRSVPESIAGALAFIEQAGDVPLLSRFSHDTLWLRTVQDVKASLVKGNTKVQKAPQFTIAMVVALELLIMNLDKPLFVRALGWFRLLKLWCSLRFGDTLGMLPERMVMNRSGLKITLVETKTTGAGKKLWEIDAYVEISAGFTGYPWLAVGFGIWCTESFRFPRDYFLPLPSKDLQSPVQRLATYSSASALGRKLLLELKQPMLRPSGLWVEGPYSLLVEPGEKFFTEHSERHFMASVTAVLNVEAGKRDAVGRWGLNSERSDAYVLTGKLVVHEVQRLVCQKLTGGSRYDEEELLDAYEAHLAATLFYDEAKEGRARMVTLGSMGRGGAWGLGTAWPLDPYVLSFLEEPIPKESYAELMGPQHSDEETEFVQVPEEVPSKPPDVGEVALAPFWISVSKKSKFQRLHRRGGCWVLPESCAEWRPLYRLEESVADSSCKLCWPPAAVSELEDEESSDGGSSSSGSESSLPQRLVEPEALHVMD